MTNTVHIAVYDTLADWEFGYATAHIANPMWQAEPGRYTVATVGVDLEPVTTAGRLRIIPDTTLDAVHPDGSAMLILPGNDLWPTPKYDPFLARAREFLDAGVPVAAICGATGGLARAGLLDDRDHTSNALEFLQSVEGYAGTAHYRDQHAVTDGDLITASSTAPVEFAREILDRLAVYPPHVLASWYKLYGDRDPAGYYELMAG